jgi:hypothetical protein
MTEESDLAAKETCDGGGALFGERRTSVFLFGSALTVLSIFAPKTRTQKAYVLESIFVHFLSSQQTGYSTTTVEH